MSPELPRRRVLKRGIASTVGAATLLGATSGTVAANDPEVYDSDTDTVGNDPVVAGLEVSAAGPPSTSVQTNELGITWGVNTEGEGAWSNYYIPALTVEFGPDGDSNPADHSITEVVAYEQGSGDPPEVVDYALDVLWSLTKIPAPNPLTLAEGGTNTNIDQGLDGFTATYNDRIKFDATGGTRFALALGTDGELEPGTYTFEASVDAPVYFRNHVTDGKVGELNATLSDIEITV